MKVNMNDLNFRVTFLALGIANIDSPQVWGRGLLNKFLYGKALYTIFHEKGAPFVDLLLTNGTPFTFLV